MIIYIGEFIGSIMYMFVGLSFTLLAFTKSDRKSLKHLIITSVGWTVAYFLPCIPFGDVSGPHLNPALTVSLVFLRKFEQRFMYGYMISDLCGAIVGILLFYYLNLEKIKNVYNDEDKANIFYATPKNKSMIKNILNEFLSTFLMIFMIFSMAQVFGISKEAIYIYIMISMFAIGMIFDYTQVSTNPFRDLPGRLLYLILPLGHKEKVNFKYLTVTVIVPVIAALLAAQFYNILPFDSAMLHN